MESNKKCCSKCLCKHHYTDPIFGEMKSWDDELTAQSCDDPECRCHLPEQSKECKHVDDKGLGLWEGPMWNTVLQKCKNCKISWLNAHSPSPTPSEDWEKEFDNLIPGDVDILHEIKTDRIFCSRQAIVNFICNLLRENSQAVRRKEKTKYLEFLYKLREEAGVAKNILFFDEMDRAIKDLEEKLKE